MRRLLALLLLCPLLAAAQGLSTAPPPWTGPGMTGGNPAGGGKVLASFAFSSTGCKATGTDGVNITRATLGTIDINNDGTVTTCQANEYRVSTDGLLVEPARTNYVLQSTTHPKVAEAMGTLPTGLYYARHTGGGTMTIAAGTSTMTGLSCTTVAVGTPCTFTVTVTGIPVITTTAGATRAQVELGAYATSWIDTAGTAVARAADAISATVPAVPSKWCLAVTAKPLTTWGAENVFLWGLGTYGQDVSAFLSAGTFYSRNIFPDQASGTYAALTTASHRLIGCNTPAALTLTVDGAPVAITPSTSGAGLVSFPANTTLYIGGISLGAPYGWTGYLKNIKLCSAKKPGECR